MTRPAVLQHFKLIDGKCSALLYTVFLEKHSLLLSELLSICHLENTFRCCVLPSLNHDAFSLRDTTSLKKKKPLHKVQCCVLLYAEEDLNKTGLAAICKCVLCFSKCNILQRDFCSNVNAELVQQNTDSLSCKPAKSVKHQTHPSIVMSSPCH